MMKAIIVDDDFMSLNNLDYLCEKISDLEVVGKFDNALDAIDFLKTQAVDVIFLDIEMPEFSGIDFVKNVKNLPQIIFTTAKSEYAMEAFEYEAIDYIQKPVTLPRLQKAVRRITNQDQQNEVLSTEYIFIKVDGRLVRIMLKDILFIETLGDYIVFFTVDKQKYIVHSTLKAMDSKLIHPDFVKVHRSYIVNISKIVDIEESNLVIADKVIPISRSHKSQLLNKIKTI